MKEKVKQKFENWWANGISMKESITIILIPAFAYVIIRFSHIYLTADQVEFFRILNLTMMVILGSWFGTSAISYLANAMSVRKAIKKIDTTNYNHKGDYDERV